MVGYEEILNGKLHFLCSVTLYSFAISSILTWRLRYALKKREKQNNGALTLRHLRHTSIDGSSKISCKACLLFHSLLWWQKKGTCTFIPWLLDSFDLHSWGSKLSQRCTLRCCWCVLKGGRFRRCSAWVSGKQLTRGTCFPEGDWG